MGALRTEGFRRKAVRGALLAAGVLLGGIAGVQAEQVHKANEIRIDPDGTLVKNGERRFVYGTFRDPSDDWRRFEGLRDAQFDLTHDYSFENRTIQSESDLDRYIEEATEYLERAKANDIGVFLGLPRNLVRSADLDQLEQIVLALKDQSALWFWYLMDEPSYDGYLDGPIKEYGQVYQLLKNLDPDRYVIVVDNQRFHSYPHGDMADMIWADRYPAPWGIKQIKEALDEANRAFPDMPSAWSVPIGGSSIIHQAARQGRSDFIELNDDNYRPNPDEIRAQAHAAIAGGAQGIVWYWYPQRWHDLRKHTPKTWQAFVDLGKELQMLEPALVSQEEAPQVEVQVSPTSRMQRLDRAYYLTERTDRQFDVPEDYDYRIESEVLHWTRWHDGALYVGLINAGYQTQVEVQLTLPFAFSRVIQFPEGHSLMTVEDGELDVDTANVPVAVLDVVDGQQLKLMMNECDVVIWRFEPTRNE